MSARFHDLISSLVVARSEPPPIPDLEKLATSIVEATKASVATISTDTRKDPVQ